MSRPRPMAQIDRRALLGCGLLVFLFLLGLALLWGLAQLFRALGIEDTVIRYREPLLWLAGLVMAGWLSAMAVIRLARQPRTPPQGPVVNELRPEAPAVANMLAQNFRATREAVAGTLLDLAARGFVDIEGTKPSTTICRLRNRDDSELNAYERMVLEILRKRAVGGIVPAGALTTGTEADADAWWKEFRGRVEDEAKAKGLSRDIWDRRTLGILALIGLAPGPLVGLATFDVAPGFVVLVPAIALLSIARSRNRQRDTPAGLVAASRWLGVRRYLQAEPAFPDLPPGSVTVWERYLAYGAALGAARGTVRTLPLGAEDDHRAWSTQGGRWRQVRVLYPKIWPPAWGVTAGLAILGGLLAATIGAFLLRGAAAIGWPDPDPSELGEQVTFLFRGLVLLMSALGTLALSWALLALIRGTASLGRTRQVRGELLRLRTFGESSKSNGVHYAAIDEGRGDRIRAYRIPEAMWLSARLNQYSTAEATVSEPIGRVVSIRMVDPGEN